LGTTTSQNDADLWEEIQRLSGYNCDAGVGGVGSVRGAKAMEENEWRTGEREREEWEMMEGEKMGQRMRRKAKKETQKGEDEERKWRKEDRKAEIGKEGK